MGPGLPGSPTRYIGVMKPIHLYMELEAWCLSQGLEKPSFQTLLRALKNSGCIRFRKVAGQHANCDVCTHFKKLLGSPMDTRQRAIVLDEYCSHLAAQWFDRAVDSNCTELSRTCRRLLDSGQRLLTLARQFSFWFLRVDGVDQAKFRVPRKAVKPHAFESLIRPALHVQGAWCEGFSFHFAVADADMKKDTNNNIEVLARLMEQLYCTWEALPLNIAIIQDNTSRECKNQLMIKWACKLVALATLVKLSLAEFEDDMDVVNILDDFLRTSGLDAGSREGAKAYKLDQAPKWIDWAETVDLAMSNLTGPEAPHYFRVCLRKHIGTGGPYGDATAETSACASADHRGHEPKGEDVVMLVKDHMASLEVSQIVLMVPEAERPNLRSMPLQPIGTHDRRPASDKDRKKVRDAALNAMAAGAISAKACDYLVQWARGTRPRHPRPVRYEFLSHRIQPRPVHSLLPNPNGPSGLRRTPRPVLVQSMGNRGPLPLDAEPEDDGDPGPMAIS